MTLDRKPWQRHFARRSKSSSTPPPAEPATNTAQTEAVAVDTIVDPPVAAAEVKPEKKKSVDEIKQSLNEKPMDVRREILNILTGGNIKGTARNKKIAEIVLEALLKIGKLFYHAERRDFDSAMFFNGNSKCLLRIRADAFSSWLSEWLGINRADILYKFVFTEIETAALSSKHSIPIIPEDYWASRPGAIYLSNGDGHAAKITSTGVVVVDNGTDGVLFPAGRTLAPWKITEPRDPFETCRLFREAYCSGTYSKDILRVWLYSLPSNPRSKPPLCLSGTVGSGKTRTIKGFAELFGMPFIAHKAEENNESDFWPACDAGGLFTLDNADTRCRWLADALANAATDGCSQRRKLYTNSETVILRARAWLAVTTANATFAADSGLADRLIVVRMERRDGEDTGDAELGAEILAVRDAGLSHLAWTLSAALADKTTVPGGLNRRHPDFAQLAVRIGRALGRERETIAALRSAEHDKAAFCLENDFIGAALITFLDREGCFTGTAAELSPKLIEVDADLSGHLSPKKLSKRLIALWPHLQTALGIAKRDPDRKGFMVFNFKKATPAEFADFETPFPIKSLCNSLAGVLEKQPLKVGNVGDDVKTPGKCQTCARAEKFCILTPGQRDFCSGPFTEESDSE